MNEQTYQYAATGKAAYPLLSPEGGKEPLRAEFSAYTMGSDHDVYQDSSFAIPAIDLNDWPDRFIHTISTRPPISIQQSRNASPSSAPPADILLPTSLQSQG